MSSPDAPFLHNAFDPYQALIDGKEFLILGGTGFFGQTLLTQLVETLDTHGLNARLVIPTRNISRAQALAPAYRHPAVTLVPADFLQQDHLEGARRPDYILHMAATAARDTHARVAQSTKLDLLIHATRAACKVMAAKTPSRVLLTSSGVIYGPTLPAAGFREHDPPSIDHLNPASALAMGKLTAEHMLASFCHEHRVPFCIARCFTFIGPGLPTDIHYAIGNFVADAVAGRDIVIRGDGQDVRSYMHIQDAIRWLCHMLFEPDAPGIMNVGSSQTISIAALAQRVAALVNPQAKIHILGQAPVADNYRRTDYWPNTDLAASRGLKLTIGLDEAIVELAAAVKRQAN